VTRSLAVEGVGPRVSATPQDVAQHLLSRYALRFLRWPDNKPP
jgi:hypothetical protein